MRTYYMDIVKLNLPSYFLNASLKYDLFSNKFIHFASAVAAWLL